MRLAALALFAFAAWPTQASAMIIYPWCAHYLGRSGGAVNCGFVTIEQCRATVSGIGGSCDRNPWYTEPQPVSRRGRAQQR